MKRLLPVAVAVLAGTVVLLDMVLTPAWSGPLARLLLEAALVLGATALLFATGHLAVTHASGIARGEPESGYRSVLLAALLITFGIGVALPGSATLSWVFRYLYTPIQATMLGLMTFVLVNAAYRVGRLGPRGARVLIGLALALLLLQVAASEAISPLFPALRDWMLAVPVTAAARGILLGVALGVTAAGLRVLLGIDRPFTVE